MKKNKHGFEPKQEFIMGGIAWTVIQTGADWVKCITSECVEEGAFDKENENDFVVSSLRAYLNDEFLRRLIKAGASEEMFEYFHIDLTAEDGLRDYDGDCVRIGLITCEEYRLLRGNIPTLSNRWWTATADSPINPFVRSVSSDGVLRCYYAFSGDIGVRPVCVLKSEILKSYLFGERDVVRAPKRYSNAYNCKCSQRYIDERRPEPPIIRGAHLSDDESYAICDKCGATSGSWKFVAHGDGLKHYFNTYNCKCGQCITVKYRRAWVME